MRIGVAAGALTLVLGPALVLYAAEPAKRRAPAKKVTTRKAAARKPVVKKTAAAKTTANGFAKDVAPFMVKYCGACHGNNNQIAGLNFQAYKDESSIAKARSVWEKTVQHIQTGSMPPKNAPQPTAVEKERLLTWVQTKMAQVDCGLKDPGRVTMRRLNRAEYNNTVRDLLGVDFRPADDFPSDDVGYGFDNIGDVLTISPLLMEKYVAAAEKITRQAILAPEDRAGPVSRFEAERMPTTGGDGVVASFGRMLHSNGAVFVDYQFPRKGEYILRARAFQQKAGDEAAKLSFRLGTQELKVVDVTAEQNAPQVYEFRTTVSPGKQRFSVVFTNDFYMPKAPNPRERDRNLGVDFLEIVGPIEMGTANLPESHRRVFDPKLCPPGQKHTDVCARKIMEQLAYRAYRRPVTAPEIDRLVKIVALAEKEGDSFERGVQLATQAILCSPNFLFRVELDPDPTNVSATRSLGDYELASRLSYFLWSSMPDAELFELAAQGKLKNTKVLEAQAVRMLKDPKAKGLVENFGDQWLTLRNLANISPDTKIFPNFNEKLRADMLTESRLFFEAIIREDRPVLDFIDSDFTFVNERLAKHYGLPGVTGEEFRKVTLQGGQRGGVLTQASVLLITSNPTRTSPVKRGKWVMEQILGTPPPPAPPNVPPLEEEGQGKKLTGTLRQRLEQHRANPVCASCHDQMDTIGFGFENFDATGAWRTIDGGSPIDPSGTLPNGQKFSGPAQLKTALKRQKALILKNFTEKMLTYALGRGLEYYDKCSVDVMARRADAKGGKFSAIVTEIVKCEPFRLRKGDMGE